MYKHPTEFRETSYKNRITSQFQPFAHLLDAMYRFEWRNNAEFILITCCIETGGLNWRIRYICKDIGELMATKTFEWDFIEIKLSRDDKQNVADFIDNYDNKVHDAVADVLELGYKVSVSWVESHSSYCCTVSGNEKTPDNNKKSITSWSNDLLESHAMMCYKVLQVCRNGPWEEHATEKATWG